MIPESIPEFSMSPLQRRCAEAFGALQARITADYEALEREFSPAGVEPARFTCRSWPYKGSGAQGKGGGCSALIQGRVFEKAGVNLSVVSGVFPDQFADQIPGAKENGGAFFATGISLVVHMRSPLVPAVHMNTRFIETSRAWFGGGSDLTPACPFDEDTADFHAALERACSAFDPGYYPEFKRKCDDYFYLPHRGETRGVGGIFFDYFSTGDVERDFAFAVATAEAFAEVFPRIVRRRAGLAWTPEDKEKQLRKRGRYAEFNLLYDRGTKFGLATGGDTEAILMSLPPEVKW